MRELQEQGKISSPAKIQNSISTIETREPTVDSTISYAVALLKHYGFELRGYTAEELINLWLRNYPANWVRLAVIEALYQGRYKAVSVEQFLAVWARRGQPIYRFNHEFERLISRKLPQNLAAFPNRRLTNQKPEPSLLPLTPSFPNLPEEARCVSAEGLSPRRERRGEREESSAISHASSAPTDQQETPPLATKPKEELTETSIEEDDQPQESLTDGGANSSYEADWSRCEAKKNPIHQFTPPPDSSDFYLKLKAVVVQQQEDILPKVITPLNDEGEAKSPPSRSDKNC